jgi:hypothetical protein
MAFRESIPSWAADTGLPYKPIGIAGMACLRLKFLNRTERRI